MTNRSPSSPSRPYGGFPSEGWLTLFTGVAMMVLLGLVIDPDNGVVEPRTLSAITALGYLIGYALAKTRMPDLLAHLIAICMGLGAAIAAVEPRTTWELARSIRIGELLKRNIDRAEVLVRSFDNGDRVPDDVAQVAISLTIWLVGYSSAWMLFRRGWFAWSVFLPSTIFLTSLALDREQPTWPALVFLGLAIAQAARFTSYSRTGIWQRHGFHAPRGIGRWSAIGGIVLSAIVVLAGLGAPLTVPENAQNWVVAQSRNLSDTLLEQADRLPTKDRGSALEGNYGQFSDEFRIGEGVPTGDTPIALLRAAGSSYLAARKFDSYDGRGWSSSFGTVSGAGTAGDLSQTPRIAFSANQPMNLPQPVLDSRNDRTGVITLYQAGNGLMLTIETHQSASVPTAIRVGWEAIDETYVIDDVGMEVVPVDLRPLIGLLRLAEFDPERLASGTLALLDASLQATVNAEREKLLKQYPVETELSFDPALGVVVHASGRLPVYEDVEGVFYSGDGNQPSTYSVVGLQPSMTIQELAESSPDYPDYIQARYLTLPDSVTPRTRALAAEIVNGAGATTPLEMAVAIQDHLRISYDYLLESSLAPEGQDIVDYFLFDRQVGRCDHFASSMIVMLRALGVPARVVTGLAPAEYDEASSGYLYRAREAHAWVEVYFPEYGWVPFEPTPSEAPIDLSGPATDQQDPSISTPTPTASQAEPEPEDTTDPVGSPEAAVTDDGSDSGSGLIEQTTTFPGIVILILGGVTLLAGILAALWLLPLRGLRPGASYFMRFQRLGKFWGVEQPGSMTPAEYAQIYGAANPRFSGAAFSVAGAFVDERYGPPDQAGNAASRGLAGWLELRKSVTAWRPWRRRRRS